MPFALRPSGLTPAYGEPKMLPHPGDTIWNKRGALWADTSKDGAPVLRGTITLLDGTKIRVKLVAPRMKKEKVA